MDIWCPKIAKQDLEKFVDSVFSKDQGESENSWQRPLKKAKNSFF